MKILTTLSLLSALAFSLAAQDIDETGPLAGHSSHGEAFNEGPRQAAYLIDGTGKVDTVHRYDAFWGRLLKKDD